MRFVNIGSGCVIDAEKILAVIAPDSRPVKEMIQQARAENKLIDATYGKRARSVINCDNGFVALSAIMTETIVDRIYKGEDA